MPACVNRSRASRRASLWQLLAVRRGGDVVCRLAGGIDAVVAAGARAEHLCVIDPGRWLPDGRGVAGLADVGRETCAAFLPLAWCRCGSRAAGRDAGVREVAGCQASVEWQVSQSLRWSGCGWRPCRSRWCRCGSDEQRARHLGVIDPGRRLPCGDDVAGLAGVAAGDVGRVLARGVRAVVAAGAVAGDPGVVEARRLPRQRRVAVLAVVVAGDVGRRSCRWRWCRRGRRSRCRSPARDRRWWRASRRWWRGRLRRRCWSGYGLAFLPVAVVPLWQDEQLPLTCV